MLSAAGGRRVQTYDSISIRSSPPPDHPKPLNHTPSVSLDSLIHCAAIAPIFETENPFFLCNGFFLSESTPKREVQLPRAAVRARGGWDPSCSTSACPRRCRSRDSRVARAVSAREARFSPGWSTAAGPRLTPSRGCRPLAPCGTARLLASPVGTPRRPSPPPPDRPRR